MRVRGVKGSFGPQEKGGNIFFPFLFFFLPQKRNEEAKEHGKEKDMDYI